MSDIIRPPTRRPPLGEATRRVNNSQHSQPRLDSSLSENSPIPHHESLQVGGLLQVRNAPASPLSYKDYDPLHDCARTGSPVNPHLSAISKEYPNSNRNSQVSTVSTNASDGKKLKAMVGPWRLGKTLGGGATARVRRARHVTTGQDAAIKIVQKRNAQISQAGSLAALDKAMSAMPDLGDGIRRMPVGIEREVAIMKLIEHPNIMKLYDIWENRAEIYLVLEYVDKGELFEYIASSGRLEEKEAIKFFRQMLSAVGYCHSINICHRDLKPENILMTSTGDIKIADFGMAALHQAPGYKLKTSCGSPHYAAPELIKGNDYRGDKADIWSMGIILFAMLAGRLPFDVDTETDRDWIPSLLQKIRKGKFDMDEFISADAKNLIWRILQVNPRERINMEQIWKHPLIRKYDHLDDFGGGYPKSPNTKDCGRPVLRKSDIDTELMRHMRSMWHALSEEQLTSALLNDAPNDQKMFYSLFLKYRDAQLENYLPDGIGYSTSDYHHVRPRPLKKTYSTCHFPSEDLKGHGRQASRFTVISNAAETEYSYDPFKASRPQHLDGMNSNRIKVTIHRNSDRQTNASLPRQSSRSSSSRSRGLAPPRNYASRSSLVSSTRSQTSGYRAPSYKRGVSFSHLRRRSIGSDRKGSESTLLGSVPNRHSSHTEVTDDGGEFLRPVAIPASTRYIRSRKAQAVVSQPLLAPTKSGRMSLLWNEDVRQLSTSLADDCDKAFNRTSVASETVVPEKSVISEKRASTGDWNPVKHSTLQAKNNQVNQKTKHDLLKTRPLPPPPVQSTSTKAELLEAKKQAEARKASAIDSPGYLDRVVSHIECLIQPGSPLYSHAERRTLSAPVEKKYSSLGRPLPSIYEAREKDASPYKLRHYEQRSEVKSSRIASAPEPRASSRAKNDDRFLWPKPRLRDTIRVVNPSSPMSPVKAPEPLVIRKMSSQAGPPPANSTPMMSGGLRDDFSALSSRQRPTGLGLRQQYLAGSADPSRELERIEEGCFDDRYSESNTGTMIKKPAAWFKRNSKGSDSGSRMSIEGLGTLQSQSSNNDNQRPRPEREISEHPKKKLSSRIGKLFKKRTSKSEEMVVGAHDVFDDNRSVQDTQHYSQTGPTEDPRSRQIEPQQSWLAKLFHVKPVSKFICFSVSKRRARQDITIILKEWRRYGIKDVQIDKERNIVFGKVAAKNYLDMKEVSFAGEIMTVIEHGKRSQLSIARFTQEQGAASSFHKVVETLETVLKCRGLLVADESKKRMMIKTLKTLNSSS